MNKASVLYKSARSVYRFVRSDLYYGVVHLPVGRARHKALLEKSTRSNSHTYTCFYRSPPQLDALTGPVVELLLRRAGKPIVINLFAGSNGSEAYTIASELVHRHPTLDFTIRGSDLHLQMVERATKASYTMAEITQDKSVPADFIARTFDKVGDAYVVKAQIRKHVSFQQADLLSPQLLEQFPPADMVVAQNVLFHMPPALARQAFERIVGALKPGGVLLIDGMELDMRVELTQRARLQPLDYRVKEIYDDSRRHIPNNWWDYYWGNEPYSYLASDRRRRYGTIFEKSAL